jgi:hypothetical protein
MKKGHPYDRVRLVVTPALKSKQEEFLLLGYGKVSIDQIWEYLVKKKWRKPKEDAPLHLIVNDILSLNVSEYMHYATIEAFKQSSNSVEDVRELLKDL